MLDITNIYYKNKLVKTTLSMIPMGGVKFSGPVAREKLTEGSLSHGSQFLTEHRDENQVSYCTGVTSYFIGMKDMHAVHYPYQPQGLVIKYGEGGY